MIPNSPSTIIFGNGFLGGRIHELYPKTVTFGKTSADICGDVLNGEEVQQAVHNKRTIVYTVGLPPTVFSHKKHFALLQGLHHVLKYMRKDAHMVFISALGVTKAVSHPYFLAKQEAERLIKKSAVSYTLIRPSIIVGPKNYLLDQTKKYGIIPKLPVCVQPILRDELIKHIDLKKRLIVATGPKSYALSQFLSRYTGAKIFLGNPRWIVRLFGLRKIDDLLSIETTGPVLSKKDIW